MSQQHISVRDFSRGEVDAPPPPAHVPLDANANGIPDHEEMHSCCSGTSDRRFGIFIVQILMTLALFTLCLVKLGDETLSCDATQLYVSLLSLLTGVWIKDLPITPEKILEAIREKETVEQIAYAGPT